MLLLAVDMKHTTHLMERPFKICKGEMAESAVGSFTQTLRCALQHCNQIEQGSISFALKEDKRIKMMLS